MVVSRKGYERVCCPVLFYLASRIEQLVSETQDLKAGDGEADESGLLPGRLSRRGGIGCQCAVQVDPLTFRQRQA